MHFSNLLYLNKYYIAQHISFRTKHMHMQTLEQFFVTHVIWRKKKTLSRLQNNTETFYNSSLTFLL